MSTNKRFVVAGVAALIGGGLVAISAGGAQSGAPAPARYTMDVTTTTMPMVGARHELALKLGSSQTATGTPDASHFMPAGALLGTSVPLTTPVNATAQSVASDASFRGERPKGKLKIFWGCGAHAGPGQPYLVDFSAPGATMARAYAAMVPVETSPAPTNSRTFGQWPNDRDSREVKAGASLVGQHLIKSNYAPEISFQLQQDFMPALKGEAGSAADGSVPLSWNAVAGATGYYAWMMGAGQSNGDMVWWVSSATREIGGGLTDWLSPATVTRLIGQKVVMPATQTSCTIPAEVKQALGQGMMMTQLYAYGPEVDMAYPARPASSKLAWHPEWTMRARFRAATTIMPGMPAMAAAAGDEDAPAAAAAPALALAEVRKQKCKPDVGGLLRGALGRGLFGGGRASAGSLAGTAADAASTVAMCKK